MLEQKGVLTLQNATNLDPRRFKEQLWLLIFGEFEVVDAEDWRVEIEHQGTIAHIHQADEEKLLRLARCIQAKSYLSWGVKRLERAGRAVTRKLMHDLIRNMVTTFFSPN